jgi:hypothetical protein
MERLDAELDGVAAEAGLDQMNTVARSNTNAAVTVRIFVT